MGTRRERMEPAPRVRGHHPSHLMTLLAIIMESALLAAQATPAERTTLDFSLVATSDYTFRGIVQRRDTLNLQPAAELGFRLTDGDAGTWKLLAGGWHNFSDEVAAGADSSFSEHWYEHDAYLGISLARERLLAKAAYTWYDSPSQDFADVQDLTLSCAVEDEGWWSWASGFALRPSVSVAVETHNAASGPDSGIWLGIAAEPGASMGRTPLGTLRLGAPLAAGWSLDDYYQRSDGTTESFGYVEVGLRFLFALDEGNPFGASAWEVGATWLQLGGVLEELNGGDADDLSFRIGMQWSW